MNDYAEKLKLPSWQKKRLKILERDNFTCQYCQDTESPLHIHHKKYIGNNPWDTPDEFLITCCEICHSIVESLKELMQKWNTDIKWIQLHSFSNGGDEAKKWMRLVKFTDDSRYFIIYYKGEWFQVPPFKKDAWQEFLRLLSNG